MSSSVDNSPVTAPPSNNPTTKSRATKRGANISETPESLPTAPKLTVKEKENPEVMVSRVSS